MINYGMDMALRFVVMVFQLFWNIGKGIFWAIVERKKDNGWNGNGTEEK